jgi:hypothetical protein
MMYALWDEDNNRLLAGPQSEVGEYDPLTQKKLLRRSGDVLEYVLEDIGADWAAINRGKRDQLLKKSDWTQLPDVPLETKEAWAAYRQALRDLPDNVNWPNLSDDDWPSVEG